MWGNSRNTPKNQMGSKRGVALPVREHRQCEHGRRVGRKGRQRLYKLYQNGTHSAGWQFRTIQGIIFRPLLMFSVLSPQMTNLVFHEDASDSLCFVCFLSPCISNSSAFHGLFVPGGPGLGGDSWYECSGL